MSTARAFAPGWFDPRAGLSHSDLPLLPPESYWQGVWRRLRANPRAMAALGFLAVLLLVTVFGPWLWPVDHARQNPYEVSRGPLPARELRVLPPTLWEPPRSPVGTSRPAAELGIPAGLQALAATTDGVRLVWQPVPGASAYRIYRREQTQASVGAGMPIASLPGSRHGHEDRLNLNPRTYIYTVVASDGVEDATAGAELAVTPEAVLPLLDAQLQGWLAVEAEPTADAPVTVRLPAHPLGTDYLGRDLLARLLEGGRTSLFVGMTAPLIFILIGTFYGAFAAYVGGRVDEWMMRFADFVIALPFLLFMILLRIAFGIEAGESGMLPLILAMVLLGWPMSARLVRGQVLQVRERAFVSAARLMGAPAPYLVWKHMVPNVIGVVIVSMTFAIPGAIFTEAFLSFIGMGVVPPTPSWGSLCNDGIRTMMVHPHELLFPAVLISVTVLAFNLLGDGLRDALDASLEPAA